jgi:hypothetical protein
LFRTRNVYMTYPDLSSIWTTLVVTDPKIVSLKHTSRNRTINQYNPNLGTVLDKTEQIMAHGTTATNHLNTKFEVALNWGSDNPLTVNDDDDGTEQHANSFVNSILAQSKKFLTKGTLLTAQKIKKDQIRPARDVTATLTDIVDRNVAASRLLEMGKLFSSMEKWATLNYAILKDTNVMPYNVDIFAQFPIKDKETFLCDVSSHQVRNDVLTMKELIKIMHNSEEFKNKIDDDSGKLPPKAIVDGAKNPENQIKITEGEPGDFIAFEKALFENTNLDKMTDEQLKEKMSNS